MRAVRYALDELWDGDTQVATVDPGSTPTVIQLTAGGATGWRRGDIAHLDGANLYLTREVIAVDTTLDKLTLDEATPSTMSAGETLSAGVQEWVTATLYHRPEYDTDVAELLDVDQQHLCVLAYGELLERPGPFTVKTEVWECRAIGRDLFWVEGLARRVERLLHDRPGAITPAGRKVHQAVVRSNQVRHRTDATMYERVVQAELQHAEAA